MPETRPPRDLALTTLEFSYTKLVNRCYKGKAVPRPRDGATSAAEGGGSGKGKNLGSTVTKIKTIRGSQRKSFGKYILESN